MGRRSSPHAFVAAILLALAFAAAPGAGVAQESTPAAMGMHDHPAHIHVGRCPVPGDIAFPLTNVTGAGMTGTPMAGMEMAGTPMAGMESSPMAGMEMGGAGEFSSTTVEATLDDILAAEHAINIHESVDNIDLYIACGDLTGTPADGVLEIELMEQNASGHPGTATLTDNGDGTTTVEVVLNWSGAMGATEATPSP